MFRAFKPSDFFELHGNHYGPDLGYDPTETLKILGDSNVKVAGICGMFSKDNDLSSNRGIQRQNAIDYIRRELDFAQAVGAGYMRWCPVPLGPGGDPYPAMFGMPEPAKLDALVHTSAAYFREREAALVRG